MENIQIYWVINCSGALSYSSFMERKDNKIISVCLCVGLCRFKYIYIYIYTPIGLGVRSACQCIVSSLNIQCKVSAA